jgi:hypothetical protein
LSGVICGKFSLKKNPLQDLLSSLNAIISTNESTQFIKGHVIYNPAYTYKFQLKTTMYHTTYIKDGLPQAFPNRPFVIGIFQTPFFCEILKLFDVNVVIILNFIFQS